MNYRSLALAIASLSFAQIATADAQSVYVAPGGVYIGGGPVYVLPGNGNGNGGYVEPTLGGGVLGPTPYLAPTAVYGNGGGYYNGGGGYTTATATTATATTATVTTATAARCSAPMAGRGSTAASCRRGRRHWCPTSTAAGPASSAAASGAPTTAIDACAHSDASRCCGVSRASAASALARAPGPRPARRGVNSTRPGTQREKRDAQHRFVSTSRGTSTRHVMWPLDPGSSRAPRAGAHARPGHVTRSVRRPQRMHGAKRRAALSEWCRKRDFEPPTPALRKRCSTG